MNNLLEKRFQEMGTRVSFFETNRPERLSVHILRDRKSEYFGILAGSDYTLEVIDFRPKMKHLLLLARNEAKGSKDKFLCGYEERHWFVAAVPEDRGVSNVLTAMEALKPELVAERQHVLKLGQSERLMRKNRAFVRQGEWFFVPVPTFDPGKAMIRTWEPLSRGTGSKPHLAEQAVRHRGELVYVCQHYPFGVTEDEYKRILSDREQARNYDWNTMLRNPDVYVRGRVKHKDHATVFLDGWHRVLMNTEHRSRAMSHVAFLD